MLEELAVELRIGAESRQVDCVESGAEALGGRDVRLHRSCRVVLELVVVGVDAEVGRRGRVSLVVIAENLPGELPERRVTGTGLLDWRRAWPLHPPMSVASDITIAKAKAVRVIWQT